MHLNTLMLNFFGEPLVKQPLYEIQEAEPFIYINTEMVPDAYQHFGSESCPAVP